MRDGGAPGDTGVMGMRPMYSKSGVWPVRKRGYHRALKRGEEWAVELSKKSSLNWLMAWCYHNTMVGFDWTKRSYLLDLVEKDDTWSGAYLPVPLAYGLPSK